MWYSLKGFSRSPFVWEIVSAQQKGLQRFLLGIHWRERLQDAAKFVFLEGDGCLEV